MAANLEKRIGGEAKFHVFSFFLRDFHLLWDVVVGSLVVLLWCSVVLAL